MAKLILPESAYKSIEGVKKVSRITSDKYEKHVEEANKRIRKRQLSYAKAANDAAFYFCK